MPTKIIVTHEQSLKNKYGKEWKAIETAIQQVIHADAARGLVSHFVPLDDSAFGQWRAKSGNPTSFKNAIDHAFLLHEKPDYIAILGGPDIVPHQTLTNPLGPNDDEDKNVPSDLPYACDAPAGQKIEAFVGPSRVVGRIPDLPGDRASMRLVMLLEQAAAWKPKTTVTNDHFGLSTHKWKRSTSLSLKALFLGGTAHVSPAEGPGWTASELKPMWHFINCHGAPVDPQFYGEKGGQFPISHQSIGLSKKVTRGTVVAAECCYGAELYKATLATGPGISITYLEAGALGFMGSTNIAYGPATTNAQADLLCRYFLESMRNGASMGRALLEARLKFVEEATPLSPVELKTLGQFLLLGDPSLRAVAVATGSKGKGAGGKGKAAKVLMAHALERRRLESKATLLTRGADVADSQTPKAAPADVYAALAAEAASEGFVPSPRARSYAVRKGSDMAARSLVAPKAAALTRFHVLSAKPESQPSAHSKSAKRVTPESGAGVPRRMIVLGHEVNGKLVKVERLFAHGR